MNNSLESDSNLAGWHSQVLTDDSRAQVYSLAMQLTFLWSQNKLKSIHLSQLHLGTLFRDWSTQIPLTSPFQI